MAERSSSTARSSAEPSRPRRLETFLEARESKRDRLVYQRVRLGILSALAVNRTLPFTELKRLLGTSDGNLAAHARKLEDAGLVECTKTFEGRIPHTVYRLTAEGRKTLERYLDHMEALLDATRGEAAP